MARVNRGDIWLYDFKPPDKRRPVVVLTRQEVIGLLRTVLVAPVTTTIRGIPSEVPVGPPEGLRRPSVVNLDHVQTVALRRLSKRIGHLDPDKMHEVCVALSVAVGCDRGEDSTTS